MMYYVEDRGEQVPAVEPHDSGWIACPYCDAETHTHGIDGPLSHRPAHCGSKPRTGYFLLRPIVSLIASLPGFEGW